MLTSEDNRVLTRVGPGTEMGDLMRRYWLPVVFSSELTGGGRAKRVRLLGEDLVVFRTGRGNVGLKGQRSDRRAGACVRAQHSLLKRWAEPREIAYPILFLASDEASYVTGTVLAVDGGVSAKST